MAPKSVVIAGFDPGSTNFGWSVVRIQISPFKYQVLAHNKIEHTIHNLTGDNAREHAMAFCTEVRRIVRRFGVTHLVAERFMTRGLKGTTIEYITLMLGQLLHVGVKNVRFVTAAQWKNRWNSVQDLNEFYRDVGVEDHQVDATNIGIYGAALWFGCPYFGFLANESSRQKFIERLERANEGKKIARKNESARAREEKAAARKAAGTGTAGTRRKRAPAKSEGPRKVRRVRRK